MGVLSATRAGARPAPRSIDAVRREFRRSREAASLGSFVGEHERLPRVPLDDALAILLGWRRDPARFDRGAVAWLARLPGYAPDLTLADSEEALGALAGLTGPSAEAAALRLSELLMRHDLSDAAAVLDAWLARRSTPAR